MKKTTLTCLLGIALNAISIAQNAVATEPKLAAADSTKKLVVSGNMDFYARHSPNGTASATIPSFKNGVGFGWINLIFTQNWSKIGFVADFTAGPRTVEIYENATDDQVLSYVKQAYLTYHPTEKLAFNVGTMTSHFNFEWTEPFDNFTYSNSMVFTVIPGFYTGANATYDFNDHWQLMVGAFGDSGIKIDRTKGLLGGGKLTYSSDKLNFAADLIGGRDYGTTDVFMGDFYADYALTEKLTVAGQFHYATDRPTDSKETSIWFGTDIYAKYQLFPRFALGFRGEQFNDADGYYFGEIGAKIWSAALTGQYRLGDWMIEPEVRFDSSNRAIFADEKKGFVKTEPSFLVAGLYRF